jgi:hypothetical protein
VRNAMGSRATRDRRCCHRRSVAACRDQPRCPRPAGT